MQNIGHIKERTRRKEILQDLRREGRVQSKYLDFKISESVNREVCHDSGSNSGQLYTLYM